jgi:alkylated DNA repair protein (DNA oxidative demethylase)
MGIGAGTLDLFAESASALPGIGSPAVELIGPDARILRRFAGAGERLLDAVAAVVEAAPLRNMITPGGRPMSVAMTNCGYAGWVSDAQGYRYASLDPLTEQRWPAMPDALMELATRAADAAGFASFEPDACLINSYAPGSRLSLHQDKNERDFSVPIVSVSLGLPATFLFGGLRRALRPQRHRVEHGDVVVWGGESRLYFHGVAPLKDGMHAPLGPRRINLTFRKAF